MNQKQINRVTQVLSEAFRDDPDFDFALFLVPKKATGKGALIAQAPRPRVRTTVDEWIRLQDTN